MGYVYTYTYRMWKYVHVYYIAEKDVNIKKISKLKGGKSNIYTRSQFKLYIVCWKFSHRIYSVWRPTQLLKWYPVYYCTVSYICIYLHPYIYTCLSTLCSSSILSLSGNMFSDVYMLCVIKIGTSRERRMKPGKRELYTVLYIGKCVFDTVYRVCVMYRLELVYRVLVCLYYTYIMHINDSNAYTIYIHITYIVPLFTVISQNYCFSMELIYGIDYCI